MRERKRRISLSKRAKEPKKKKRPYKPSSSKEDAMSSSVTSIADWQKRVAELVPSLSVAQARVLGLISYGIIQLDGCGLTRLCNGRAKIEQVPASRLRQRVREFYYEAQAKRGKKRREVDVQTCFGDLLAGILRNWQGKKELALALDASTLGKRFTSLSSERDVPGMWYPSSLDHHRSRTRGKLATVLGAAVATGGRGGAKGVEGDRAGRPRVVRGLALQRYPAARMAPVSARQLHDGLPSRGRGRLRTHWDTGTPQRSGVGRARGVE
jgi:hypothetical protein